MRVTNNSGNEDVFAAQYGRSFAGVDHNGRDADEDHEDYSGFVVEGVDDSEDNDEELRIGKIIIFSIKLY